MKQSHLCIVSHYLCVVISPVSCHPVAERGPGWNNWTLAIFQFVFCC